MMTRYVAICAATLGLAGCSDRDALAPWDVAGVWVASRPDAAFSTGVAVRDTLVLDGRGGGRIVAYVPVGQVAGEVVEERWSSPVRYRMAGGGVRFDWCLTHPAARVDCDRWAIQGSVDGDGLLWIGPTSPVSSAGPVPWRRTSRAVP